MTKSIISVIFLFFSNFIQAGNPFYQVDVILFAHQQEAITEGSSLRSTLPSNEVNSIPLQLEISKNKTPYHLLPTSFSDLKEEFWALHRRSEYKILFNYTWLQPLNNKNSILIPKILRDGWEIEGKLSIQRTNYYSLESHLLITHPDNKQNPYVFSLKQRLKGGDIYYLDHPQVGMLIKIHQLT